MQWRASTRTVGRKQATSISSRIPPVLPMLGEINIDQWRCVAELVDNAVDGFLKESRAGSSIAGAKVDARAFRVLGIHEDVVVSTTFIKPHGCLLADGRQIAWSKASDWKATLMALHERAFMEGQPYAAVLTEAAAKFALASQRAVVESVAE